MNFLKVLVLGGMMIGAHGVVSVTEHYLAVGDIEAMRCARTVAMIHTPVQEWVFRN